MKRQISEKNLDRRYQSIISLKILDVCIKMELQDMFTLRLNVNFFLFCPVFVST